ncbi:ImmA/IrrE family metallo-endopeptidase [Crocosphaera sp.]|uniref:ImmA/IrrE family metallo-endopeptidase n=1 Tax=Crocosphaera sp. TaxID=2729996 RepID=UPI002622CB6E|nr:ImmA/IrrE family metallo-endopeptidase [Crocosphaera sp.]MDJ0581826.1 ImmA/IrrE family metallo-endopeptidase [Crocosphaera sp.]
MTQTLTMSALYKKLATLGLNKKYIQSGLPSWWDDELNEKPFAVLEGAGYIADNFNIDLKSLLTLGEEVKFNPSPQTKFKQHNSKNKEHPHVAQSLASRVAELISYGINIEYKNLPNDAQTIREEILSNHKTVNLESLLDYCWSKGIAVGYFNHFPKKTKKFAGLIQWQKTFPVIILSAKHTHRTKFTFDLAHELGHLALGHLQEGILIDESLEFDSKDDEEKQANQFAVKLLLNKYDNYLGNNKFKNAENLARYVRNFVIPKLPNIEPDAVILNYGWHNKNCFRQAMAALNILEVSTDGQTVINDYLADKLDWDMFSDETYEYLEKVLGV